MVIDYSERRQSQRIQPKRPVRPSVWPYVLLILIFVAIAYLLGLGTGWFLYRPGGRFYKPAQLQPANPTSSLTKRPPAVPANQAAPGQQPISQQPAVQPASDKSAPIPLTFYDTLQKGNKSLMGTGINTPKEGQGAAPKKVTPAAPER
jgi:hypothetical protein